MSIEPFGDKDLFLRDAFGNVLSNGPFPRIRLPGVEAAFELWTLRGTVAELRRIGIDLSSNLTSWQSRRLNEILTRPFLFLLPGDVKDITTLSRSLHDAFPSCKPPTGCARRSWTVGERIIVAELMARDVQHELFEYHWQGISENGYSRIASNWQAIANAYQPGPAHEKVFYVDTDAIISQPYVPINSTPKQPAQEKPMASSFSGSAPLTHDLLAVPSASTLATETKRALERAAWSTAASKAAETLRDALIVKLVGTGDPSRMAVAAFLSTDEGLAAISAFAGYAVLFSPKLQADARVARLGTELRVGAATQLTNSIADLVIDPILAAFSAVVAGLPAEVPEAPAGEGETS